VHTRRLAVTDALRRRILAGLHLGTMAPGDRAASVRAVGEEFRAGTRVVLAAYRELAGEGLVRLRPRSGVFLAGSRDDPGDDLPDAASWAIETCVRAVERGLPPDELWRQMEASLHTVTVRAACVECNDDQIHALCRQAHEAYGYEVVPVDLGASPRTAPGDAAGADVILTTHFHAEEARGLGRRLRRPVVVATLDPVFVNTVRGLLERGRVFWVCTDPRFAAKLPVMFPGGSLHPVVLGRDPLGAIPESAMVYASRRAAERLPARWRAGHVVTVPRAFSPETSRALVTVRVRANLAAVRRSARG
jgi:DNA-binding transcriptional regulator YhcF (GntR family)